MSVDSLLTVNREKWVFAVDQLDTSQENKENEDLEAMRWDHSE